MANHKLNWIPPVNPSSQAFRAIALQLSTELDQEVPVDTGELRDSKIVAIGDDQASYLYDADYAIYVHEGSSKKNGTVVPPNRWTERAANNLNI